CSLFHIPSRRIISCPPATRCVLLMISSPENSFIKRHPRKIITPSHKSPLPSPRSEDSALTLQHIVCKRRPLAGLDSQSGRLVFDVTGLASCSWEFLLQE